MRAVLFAARDPESFGYVPADARGRIARFKDGTGGGGVWPRRDAGTPALAWRPLLRAMIARALLRREERGVDRPFTVKASLRLDRALVRVEPVTGERQ